MENHHTVTVHLELGHCEIGLKVGNMSPVATLEPFNHLPFSSASPVQAVVITLGHFDKLLPPR